MTSSYNRSGIIEYSELTEDQQKQILDDYSFEDSDAYSTSYVMFGSKKNGEIALPLCMFIRHEGKFTHGIYSTSAFDGYFITFNKGNDCAIIAHKHF